MQLAVTASAAVIYVNQNAAGANNGSSWTNAYNQLFTAVQNAQAGDEIWVAAGVYRPTLTNNRDLMFTLGNDIRLYGGFNGSETTRNQRNWTANATILSADIGVAFVNTDNSRRLLDIIGTGVIVDGFQIRNVYDETVYSTGAVRIEVGAELTLRNCLFRNNLAEGASVASVLGTATFENCLVRGNTNEGGSGLINGSSGAVVEVIHCTFSDNTLDGVSSLVGGAYVADVRVYNSILANGSSSSSYVDFIANSVVEGTVHGPNLVVENLLTADPMFIDPADDFHLQEGSPAINHGSVAYVTSGRDFDGRPRIFDNLPDAGCYEFQSRPVVFVNPDAVGNGSGFTWTNAYTDLQVALAATSAGSQIWVKTGTYYPTTTSNRFTSFNLSHDVIMYGGFIGNENALGQRDWIANPTVLSGNIGNANDASDNSYNVVVANEAGGDFTLNGFVVEGGYADGTTLVRQRGAGIRVNSANSLMVRNCDVRNNYAIDEGAGIFTQNALEVNVISSKVRNNEATVSSAIFSNATMRMESVAVINNSNLGTAPLKGVVTLGGTADVDVINCTFTENDFDASSGSFLITAYSLTEVRNSIISGNGIDANESVVNPVAGTYAVSHSILEGLPLQNPGPQVSYGIAGFNNPNTGDYRLLQSSPGFNQGDPSYILSNRDADGNVRTLLGQVDFGAFETDVELSPVIYVNQAATGANNGTSWNDAFTDLQDALAVATPGNEVWVAAGVYKPTATSDRYVAFEPPGGVTLLGGFNGTETLANQRNWVANQTVLSGEIGVPADLTDNTVVLIRVFNQDSPVLISGFSIRRAYSDAAAPFAILESPELSFENCIFTTNTGQSFLFYTVTGSLKLQNCLLAGNSTDDLFTAGMSDILLTGVTIANNDAMRVINLVSNSSFEMRNSIVWQSTTGQSFGAVVSSNSMISDPGFIGGVDNIMYGDPQFVNPAGNDYRLLSSSPAIDLGSNDFVSLPTDLDLKPRIYGDQTDAGCYESVDRPVIFVDQDATGAGTGLTWADAFTDLHDAFAVAESGSQIWVTDGDFIASELADIDAYFTLPDGVDLIGGFSGFETAAEQRDLSLFTTINGSLGPDANGTYVRSKRLMLISGNTEGNNIENFQFTGSEAPLNVVAPNRALHIEDSENIHLARCGFVFNVANRGSAVYFASSSGSIDNAYFIANQAQNAGVIGMIGGSDVRLTNVTIHGNELFTGSGSPIGGTSECTLEIRNSIIWGNTSSLSSPNVTTMSHTLLDGFVGQNGESPDEIIITIDNPFEESDWLALREGSPAVDAGSELYQSDSPVDALGQPRVQGLRIDLGAWESPYTAGPDCVGDFDNDGLVGAGDLLVLLADFGCSSNCSADLTGDDSTGISDLLVFLTVFGNSCLE